MIFQKLKYRISKILSGIIRKTGKFELNWGYLAFSIFCIISILLLGVNIFRIIQKGYQRYEIIQEEKARLDVLIEKNEKLKEDLEYYSSMEYVDIKAREELNLAFPEQRLVFIEEDYVFKEDDDVQEDAIEPDWRLWYDLIF